MVYRTIRQQKCLSATISYLKSGRFCTMGRKSRRKNSNSADEQQMSDGESDVQSTPAGRESIKPNVKDLDFADRRELQRQKAAEKRRSKMKCFLCGKSGHVRRECPGIADDGRGMSRFKGKSDVKQEKQKYVARKGRSGSKSYDESSETLVASLEYPEEFVKAKELAYIDVHCDIPATIEYLRCGRGKAKLSRKEAIDEYLSALKIAADKSNLVAVVSKSFLVKPNRPWINPIDFQIDSVKVFFAVGIDESWKVDDETHCIAAVEALQCAVRDNPEVIAVFSSLDMAADTLVLNPGSDLLSQTTRLKCCCKAAAMKDVPLQLQVLPGASSLDPEVDSVAGTDYARALLELQANVMNMIEDYPNLRIHLIGWCGRACHMMALLQAFPNNIVAVGLDGAVSFSKAEYLHECAFDVPLDRLVIETANIIPSNVANEMGRGAFPQSGWWPFIAECVANYKRFSSIEQIISAAYDNTLKLYPPLGKQI